MKHEQNMMDNSQIIEQLRAENKLKTKWLSLIAHDFRGLFSNIQLLLNAMDSKNITPEIFMSMLPELKQIAEKNSKTLENTLIWVKSQTNGYRPHIEEVVIRDLFDGLKKELGEAISAKELTLHFVGDKETTLYTDKFLLRFILKQLIDNAIKYSNKEGAIEFVAHSESGKVNITIHDHGVGMKDSRQTTIGTLDGAPYTGTMDEKGAGLSLVIVKGFVELLGGAMHVASVEGVGTSVEIGLQKK